MQKELKEELAKGWKSLWPPLLFVSLLWLIKFFEYFTRISLSHLGTFPLKISGLTGILLSPLLHGDFNHLASNSLPVLLLGWALFYFYEKTAYRIMGIVWLGSGIAVWLFARENYHIGASGLIYGIAAFLFFSGFLKRNNALLAISLLVTIFYGGMVWGILPLQTNISWESHLSGGAFGFACAFIYRKAGPQPVIIDENEDENDTELWNLDKINVPPPFRIEQEEPEGSGS